MANFASVVAMGGVAPALRIQCGDSRVTRWPATRPNFDQDEFIDDIPFPETQNYVKRIIGTADDYRALYSDLPPAQVVSAVVKPAAPPAQTVRPAPANTATKAAPKPASKAPSKAPAKKATKAAGKSGKSGKTGK